jgi:hypothetical protein
MSSLVMAAIALVCSFGGASLGLLLGRRLPDSHLTGSSADVVKMSTGLVGTMSALVLGLLVASANGEFNTESGGIQKLSTNFLLLDGALRHFGPEAAPAREGLREIVEVSIRQASAGSVLPPGSVEKSQFIARAEGVFDAIRDLKSQTDGQKLLHSQCVQICAEIARTRWALIQGASNPIPTPFLVVLVFWLVTLYLSFGLLAPRNGTVIAAMLVSSISVAAAIFLIFDLNEPFDGLIRVSVAPLRDALGEMRR